MELPKIIHPTWIPHLAPLFETPELLYIRDVILPSGKYYPPKELIFRAFSMPLNEIKVVILGQDPYPQRGKANGLAFAVNRNVITMPFSLKMIYRELLNEAMSPEGLKTTTDVIGWQTLEHWHDQGVFLFNTALTVAPYEPNSHKKYWEKFIGKVIEIICKEVQPIWLIWGGNAKQLAWGYIYPHHEATNHKHSAPDNRTMTCSHPASEFHNPGNGGFLGCNHFSKVNQLLKSMGKQEISW